MVEHFFFQLKLKWQVASAKGQKAKLFSRLLVKQQLFTVGHQSHSSVHFSTLSVHSGKSWRVRPLLGLSGPASPPTTGGCDQWGVEDEGGGGEEQHFHYT